MNYLEVISPYLAKIDTPGAKLDKSVFNEALLKLEPVVDLMLRGDMNIVFNVLYRLDVSEEKVKFILFGTHEEKASKLLAEAILEREIVRRIFRLKYSK